jgi:hypothetical protein
MPRSSNIHSRKVCARLLLATPLVASLALFASALFGPSALAACGLVVTVRNTGSAPLVLDWGKSHVRTDSSGWQPLDPGQQKTVAPGSTVSVYVTAKESCQEKRRYRIHASRGATSLVTYVPSETTFTTNPHPSVSLSL